MTLQKFQIPIAGKNKNSMYCMLFGAALIIIAFVLGEQEHDNIEFIGLWISIKIIALYLAELLRKYIHVCGNKGHSVSKLYTLLQEIFSTSIPSCVAFSVSVIYLITYFTTQGRFYSTEYAKSDLFRIGLIFIAVNLNSQHFSMDAKSINIADMKPLDIGSAMAYSIYYGYLKIVLPPSTTSMGFIKKIENYESRTSIKFSAHKVYILVPLSCHCPKSLMHQFSPSVSIAEPLHVQVQHRAGVTARGFHTPVYKIQLKDRLLHVCAEYATPLNTMEDAIQSGDDGAAFYKKYKPDIVLNFYDTLKRLIEKNPETRGLCEVIVYDDYDDKGIPLDVGLVIAQFMRIQK